MIARMDSRAAAEASDTANGERVTDDRRRGSDKLGPGGAGFGAGNLIGGGGGGKGAGGGGVGAGGGFGDSSDMAQEQYRRAPAVFNCRCAAEFGVV
jgi:hypothetical protein